MSDDNSQAEDRTAEPTIFSALMTPHRSLSSTGFLVLMLGIGAVSFVSGCCFC